MQRIPIDEIFFFNTHKQLNATVDDPDSSDTSRLYPNKRYRPERLRFNLIEFPQFFSQRT